MKAIDNLMWKPLKPLADGFVPRIPRVYRFRGNVRGQNCNFPVRIVSGHPSLPHVVSIMPLYAMNCAYIPDWANLSTLTEIA